MSIELRPASSFDLGELARLFTAAYEEYVVPFQVSGEQLRFMVDTFDLDLDASRVALKGGVPVALGNLGVRGDQGWIGGIGVVPSARRQGIARTIMNTVHDVARAQGVLEVWLEVMEQNEAAYRLYEQLGYRVAREVELGLYDGEPDGVGSAREAPFDEAHALVRELRRERDAWQRADETLAHYTDLRGLVADGGAAVFRLASEGRALLLQLAGDEHAARELLTAMRTHGPVAIFNVPVGDPALAALHALGGRVTLRQREMVLSL